VTADLVPDTEAIAADMTPRCRDLFWQYRAASNEAFDAMAWLMTAQTPAEAEARAPQAALTERKATSLFNDLRTSLIRSRPGGFDPVAGLVPTDG
jgi:hypothetical protein